MADADQQQGPCDEVAAPFESTAAAVSHLFREHNHALVDYLTARLRSEQEAKEVAQETYVRLLQMQDPGTPGLLRAYLFKTATNLAIDRLRHRKVRHRAEEQPGSFDDSDTVRSEFDDPAKQLTGARAGRPASGLSAGVCQSSVSTCSTSIDSKASHNTRWPRAWVSLSAWSDVT